MLNDDGAVVVWQSGKAGAQNIFARFLTVAGGLVTSEVLVNSDAAEFINRYTTNWVLIRNNKPRNRKYRIREKVKIRHEFNANATVTALRDGSVVVAYAGNRVFATNTFMLRETLRWDDRRSIFITNRVRVPGTVRLDAMQDIFVQRMSAAGQKLGSESRANEFLAFNQRDPALTALDNGNFVVAWVTEQQRYEDSVDIFARVFDALGNALTGEFQVNSENRPGSRPTLTALAGGGFTIAWTQKSAEAINSLDIHVRTFGANGSPTSDPVVVNQFTYGDQFAPSIVSLGAQQLLVWSSMGQDGSWEGVFARALNGAVPLEDEFRMNISTPFNQMHPQVGADRANGRAMVIWSGFKADSGFDLFGRTYGLP
jgi:hypothetical protein